MKAAGSGTYPGTARLAFTLAAVSGFVDGVGASFIAGIFVSFMSGNTTSTGIAVGTGQWAKAWHAFLPIPLYVLGVILSSVALIRGTGARTWIYALCAALLAGFGVLAQRVGVKDGWTEALGVALLVLPMGALNATLRHVGPNSVGLGYITGTLAGLGENLARWLTSPHSSSVRLYLGLWLSFFGGACLGGFGVHRFGAWAVTLPVLVLVALLRPAAI